MADDSSEESHSSIDDISTPAQSCTLPPETEAALRHSRNIVMSAKKN